MASVVVVTIDAGIAAGKTTLIARLRHALRFPVVVAEEPVEAWKESGLLAEMYAALSGPRPSPDGMPGMFQVYAFSTRIGKFAPAHREATRLAQESGARVVLLCERSIFSDRDIFKAMLVAAGHITPLQERVYTGCFDAWAVVAGRATPDLAVWLDTPVGDCMQRQAARARPGEKFDRTYAEALDEQHRAVFGSGRAFDGVPVLRIDGATPFHTDDAVLRDMADSIAAAIDDL
jgi:deoxyadenosine/deoxycytidine kinase